MANDLGDIRGKEGTNEISETRDSGVRRGENNEGW